MDQTALQVTAPNDPDPRRLDGYIAVLREAGTKEKNVPYRIGRVRHFVARFPGRPRRDLVRAEIEIFRVEARSPAVRPRTGGGTERPTPNAERPTLNAEEAGDGGVPAPRKGQGQGSPCSQKRDGKRGTCNWEVLVERLEVGQDIRTVQALRGHANVETTRKANQ